MSENLQVKIVAETGNYKRDIQEAKAATKEFGDEGKIAAAKLEVLEAQIDSQKARLATLKEKYDKLVASEKGASAAAKDLQAKMKLLNTQIELNEQKLKTTATATKAQAEAAKAAAAAQEALKNSLHADAVGETNSEMSQFGDTLQNIRNLQMADVFLKLSKALKDVKQQFTEAGRAFKLAKEEFVGAFNFKDFDVGEDGIKGIFQSMKIQGKESINSLLAGFKKLGAGIKAAMSTAVAAIAAAMAVLITFIALIKNAINTAQRLRDTFYEAQKIGMSASAYGEWAYVLNNVGVGVDKLSDFLKTLADEQNAVRDGDEDIIKAFERLGMTAEEVGNMSQEKLFSETVKGLQGIENEVERTSIAYRIFGEDAAELTNVINLNNEEMDKMLRNYYLLGGGASDSAIQKSLNLSAAISDLKTAWKGLTTTLGEGFMPMVITVVRWLTRAIAIVNMFIRAMFGFDIVATGSKSTEKAADSMNSYEKAMDKAKDTADKLRRSTQGFDELNIVADPAKSSSSGGDDDFNYDIGGGFDLPDFDAEFADLGLDKVAEKIKEWSDVIRGVVPMAMLAVGLIGGVLAALSGNWVLAIALFAMAGFGLVAMTSGEGGFQGYIDSFGTACDGLLAPAMVAIGAIGGLIALLFGAIPIAIGLFAMAGLGIVLMGSDGFQSLTDGFAGKVALIVMSAMVAIGVIGGVIALLFGAIPIAIGLFAMAGIGIAGLTAGGFWDDIGAWFKDLFKGIGDWCKKVWAGICDIFNAVVGWFKDIFTKAWNGIKDAWKSVKNWFSDLWKGIKDVFSSVGDWFSNIFKKAWTGIKNAFNSVGDFFNGIWTKIKNIFSKAGTAIGEGVSKAFSGAINWVLEKAIGIINGFLKAINAAIGFINKIPGVNIKKIALLDVPKLATGGIAVNDTLAHIGEGGKREAVLPLDQNTEWMDILADRIAARNQGPTKIVLQVGEKELGWASIKSINSITKQTGGLQLHLV